MPHDQDSSSRYGIPHGIWDANTCSWRTSQLSLFGEAQCLTKSPAQGMTLNGQLFQHNPWAHLISEEGGGRSVLPTATTDITTMRKKRYAQGGTPLTLAVSMQEQQQDLRLNPEWVECLMGYPPGWTDISGPQEEESSPSPMSHQESEKEETEMSQNLQHLETPLFPNALMS